MTRDWLKKFSEIRDLLTRLKLDELLVSPTPFSFVTLQNNDNYEDRIERFSIKLHSS